MTLSGWCGLNPPGTEPKHGACQWLLCSCSCHEAPITLTAASDISSSSRVELISADQSIDLSCHLAPPETE